MSTLREKFEEIFFRDIHERLVDFLSGKISTKLSEQDVPDIDEYYIQEESKSILENRIPKFDNALRVIRNKSHSQLKDEVMKKTGKNFNPQLDVTIIGKDNGMLCAAYEVKSRLQRQKLNQKNIYEDIQRLAIVKTVFPKSKCIFLLPGLSKEMNSDFEELDLQLPNTFNIDGNPNYKRKGGYKNIVIRPNIEDNNYSGILEMFNVKNIIIRLSQTAKGRKHILFTYEIKTKFVHQ